MSLANWRSKQQMLSSVKNKQLHSMQVKPNNIVPVITTTTTTVTTTTTTSDIISDTTTDGTYQFTVTNKTGSPLNIGYCSINTTTYPGYTPTSIYTLNDSTSQNFTATDGSDGLLNIIGIVPSDKIYNNFVKFSSISGVMNGVIAGVIQSGLSITVTALVNGKTVPSIAPPPTGNPVPDYFKDLNLQADIPLQIQDITFNSTAPPPAASFTVTNLTSGTINVIYSPDPNQYGPPPNPPQLPNIATANVLSNTNAPFSSQLSNKCEISYVDSKNNISYVVFGNITGFNGVVGLINVPNTYVQVTINVNGTPVIGTMIAGASFGYLNNLMLNGGVNWTLTDITFGNGTPPPPPPPPNPLSPVPTGSNLPTVDSSTIPKWVHVKSNKTIYYHQQWDIYGTYDSKGVLNPQLNLPNSSGRNYRMTNIPDDVTDVAYAFWWVDEWGNVASADDWADHELPSYGNLKQPQPQTNEYCNSLCGFQWPPQRFALPNAPTLPSIGNFGDLIAQNAARVSRGINPLNCSLTIGGWSYSKYFSNAVSTNDTRTNFINCCIYILRLWQDLFTGIIFDWEFITDNGVANYGLANNANPVDVANFASFLQGLQQAIISDPVLTPDGKTRTITIGMAVTPAPEKAQFNINLLNPYIDEFHIMTYDLHGKWDASSKSPFTGFHSNPLPIDPTKNTSYPQPTYSVLDSVNYYLGKLGQVSDDASNIGFVPGTNGSNPVGYPQVATPTTNLVALPNIPSTKFFIGSAFYSRGVSSQGPYTKCQLLPTTDKSLYPIWEFATSTTPVDDPGVLPYSQIVGMAGNVNNGWGNIMNDTDTTDDKGNVVKGTNGAYIVNSTNNYCLTFDNAPSIISKIQLINDNQLGGMIVWEDSTDIRIPNGSSTFVSPVGSLTNTISTNLKPIYSNDTINYVNLLNLHINNIPNISGRQFGGKNK